MNKKVSSLCSAFIIGIFIVIADRVTKYWMVHSASKMVILPILSLCLVNNRGISWGYLDDGGDTIFALIILATSALSALVMFIAWQRWNKGLSIIGEVMIIAGSLSNIVDRFVYGAVIDFIAFHYKVWEFAVFNIADFFIVLGILIIMIRNYRNELL